MQHNITGPTAVTEDEINLTDPTEVFNMERKLGNSILMQILQVIHIPTRTKLAKLPTLPSLKLWVLFCAKFVWLKYCWEGNTQPHCEVHSHEFCPSLLAEALRGLRSRSVAVLQNSAAGKFFVGCKPSDSFSILMHATVPSAGSRESILLKFTCWLTDRGTNQKPAQVTIYFWFNAKWVEMQKEGSGKTELPLFDVKGGIGEIRKQNGNIFFPTKLLSPSHSWGCCRGLYKTGKLGWVGS